MEVESASARWSQKGWGYVVALASFLAAFLLDGMEGSYGVLMPSLLDDLEGSVSVTSLAGGLITGVALGIGPIISRFIERFGCRPIAMVGGITCFVSLTLSTLSVNMAMFMVFYGVCTGAGIGMVYMSYITAVNTYFDTQRSIALGIVTSGSGVGLLTMALLINTLIASYGWRGCYLIIAAIFAHLCAIAFIMRPLKPPKGAVQPNPQFGDVVELNIDADTDNSIDLGQIVDKNHDENNSKWDTMDDQCERYDVTDTSVNDVVSDETHKLRLLQIQSSPSCQIKGDSIIDTDPANDSSLFTHSKYLPFKNRDVNTPGCKDIDVFFKEKQPGNSIHHHLHQHHQMLLSDSINLPVNVKNVSRSRRQRSDTTYSQPTTGLSEVHVDARLLELSIVVPRHNSLPDVSALVRRALINLPPECVISSVLSMVSVGSRTSKKTLPRDNSSQITIFRQPEVDTHSISSQGTSTASCRSLLTNPVFLIFCYGAFSFQLAFGVAPMFTPTYALSVGLSKAKAASLLSVLGISNMAGRILAGVLSFMGLGSIRVYIIGTLLGGLVCFMVPWCVTYTTLLLFAGSHGFFFGVFFPLQSVLLVEILGIDQLPRSFGIMCFCKSMACMLGPFLAGALFERTQDYSIPFLFSGVIILIASFLQIILAIMIRQKSCLRNEDTEKTSCCLQSRDES